ncbi:ABC transporter ATP-binding protein [Clostridium celatum]|uniref:Nickel import system ATP-binding protein NikD n=1 Tax=Clostridium celatum DSM 1785 TaxID=545697 RepID=L1Q218_9CLOT|nr:ABC transporter ATP-binding protein [Clostridium celatum]EKY22049.1 ABC transporter, ATP-binding protein [Clostridium celatum DSM 1785]MCE9654483.1 ABC transporter ATP-binding protein [Clostridium celatum]MDU3722285.1 ABC transporter ATP-binding protein [Clostridium celatum]
MKDNIMVLEENEKVLEVENLSVAFSMYDKGLNKNDLEVIHELSINVKKGEIVAVVGSSGSGKSLLAHAIMGILPGNAKVKGNIKFCEENLTEKYLKKIRGKDIAFIPQSIEFLDPLMKIGKQVIGINGNKEKQREVFKKYDLDDNVADKYPFQLSGGMARRVLIATAVMNNVKLIIADEPTPGLNLELAMDTLKHFREIANSGCGVLLITHDVDLALNVADRIAVFYSGTIVEIAKVYDFIKGKEFLRHPYSKAFIDALPQNKFKAIPGFQPYAGNLPTGCLFGDRCPIRSEACNKAIEMRRLRGGEVRCINAT